MTEDEKPPIKGILKVLQPIPEQPPEPKPDVIAMLEDALARAKSGEVSGVVVLLRNAQNYGYDFAGIQSMGELLGFSTICDLAKRHLIDIIAMNSE